MKDPLLVPLFILACLVGYGFFGRATECSQLCGCAANLGCSCVANNAADCECQNCTCKAARKRCCKEAK